MPDIQELFQSAVQLQSDGQSDPARQLYEQILAVEPRHAGALNSLGLIAIESGAFDRAIEYYRRAIAADGTQALLFVNLAEVHRRLGQWQPAIGAYRQAIRLAPHAVQSRNNLGTVLQQAGLLDEAAASFAQALQIEPRNADVHFNLGCALGQQGKLQAARDCYRRALEIDPAHRHSWISLGDLLAGQRQFADAQTCYERARGLDPRDAAVCFALGNACHAQGKRAEAIECFRQAIALNPDDANIAYNLANTLREAGRLDEAVQHARRAVELRPDFAVAHSNLGVILQELGRAGEAQTHLETAVRLQPAIATFHFNLGTAHKDQGRLNEAIDCYQQALALDPRNAQVLCARGAALLQGGALGAGWIDYEQRLNCPQFDMTTFSQPVWDGSPLGQRRLLVYCEQGLGDTLQFVRYARLFGAEDRVVLAAQPSLIPLLEQSGYRRLVSKNEPPGDFDVYALSMSLPRIFRTELATIPADVPYITADEARIARWRDRLGAIDGLKVGIAWQGKADYRRDRFRSIPLKHFAPLADVPSVRLLSLQKGTGSEQLSGVDGRFDVVDLAAELDNEGSAFLDTAAVMKNLDLVITSDTSIAHLAGALAVPVWVALCAVPDWRWMLDRSDSPWYPTMRLFRQAQWGAWDDMFARMAVAVGDVRRLA